MRWYVALQIASTTPQRPPTTPQRPSTTPHGPFSTPQNGVLDNIILDCSTTPVFGVVGGFVEWITPQRVYPSSLLACMKHGCHTPAVSASVMRASTILAIYRVWLVDSIQAYIRVDVSGQMAIRDLRNSDVAGHPGIKWMFIDFLYSSGYLWILNIFLSASGSPSRLRVCCTACGTLEPREKTRTGFLEHVPYGFYWFVVFFNDFNIFLLVLGSPSKVRLCCAACGASEPSEKSTPEILEHVPSGFYWFVLFLVRLLYLFAGFRVSQ